MHRAADAGRPATVGRHGAAAVAERVRSKRDRRRGAPARPQHVLDREGAPRAEPAALATDEGAVEMISTAPGATVLGALLTRMTLIPLQCRCEIFPRLLQLGDGLHAITAVVALVMLELVDGPLQHLVNAPDVPAAAVFAAPRGLLTRRHLIRGRGLSERNPRCGERRGDARDCGEKLLASHCDRPPLTDYSCYEQVTESRYKERTGSAKSSRISPPKRTLSGAGETAPPASGLGGRSRGPWRSR